MLLLILGSSPSAADTSFLEAVVSAIESDDITSLQRLSVPAADLSSIDEIIQRYECADVIGHPGEVVAETDGTRRLALFLDGVAETAGAVRERHPLPARWFIEIVETEGQWRIRSVRTAERALALHAAVSNDVARIRSMILAKQSLDPGLLLRELAAAQTDAAGCAAIDGARALGDPEILVAALRQRILTSGVTDGERMATALEACIVASLQADADVVTEALFAVGNAHFRGGREAEADRYFSAAGQMMDRVRDPRLALQAEYTHSHVQARFGNAREAILSAERVRAGATRYRWREGEVIGRIALANAHAVVRGAAASCHYNAEALAVAQQYGVLKLLPILRHNTQECAFQFGNRDLALNRLRENLQTIGAEPNLRTSALVQVGARMLSAGLTKELSTLLEREEATARKADSYGDFLLLRGQVRLAEGHAAEALQDVRASRRAMVTAGRAAVNVIRDSAWSAAVTEARALRSLGLYDEAIAAYRSAMQLSEDDREAQTSDSASRATFLGATASAYRELAELLIERGQHREALLITEKTRARVLRDVLSQRVQPVEKISPGDAAREASLRQAVVEASRAWLQAYGTNHEKTAETALQRARASLTMFRTELYLRNAPLRLQRGTSVDALPASGQLLPSESAAVVSYCVFDMYTIAFVLTRRAEELRIATVKMHIGRRALDARIRAAVASLGQRDLAYRRHLRTLYDTLLRPLEPHLVHRDRLCILPDGPLWHLPFAALIAPDQRYAVERWVLSYAPSLDTFNAARPVRPERLSLMAFGNPAVPHGTVSTLQTLAGAPAALGRLSHAEAEVRQVASLYERAKVYTGRAADERRAKQHASEYTVLHFATHAVVDDAAPLYSALVLSGSANEDGLLEAREVLDLRLNADLAILSACETAHGQERPGEGLIGFSWALMVAGCPRAVVSSWRVDSESTAALMVAFHRAFTQARRRRDPASALRTAQLKILSAAQFSHPYYWAAFQVVGYGW
ncbi:MAG TPA: CHAT domain-containing protein [Thermoanaerobaculia bacterium]|nr:CHAT domain-containing protein [Thermoanaerobaculia bacterium]